MEGKLRVNVTCTTADSGPLPFSVLMSEDETVADMVARLRKELQARAIPVQVFAGPVSTAMASPLGSLQASTFAFSVMSEDEYVAEFKTPPVEYVQKPERFKPKQPARVKHAKPKRKASVADPSEPVGDYLTAPHVSCHKCRTKRDWVYVCPHNDKHRFCPKCIGEPQLEEMKLHGCPVCLGTCSCSSCKKRHTYD